MSCEVLLELSDLTYASEVSWGLRYRAKGRYKSWDDERTSETVDISAAGTEGLASSVPTLLGNLRIFMGLQY